MNICRGIAVLCAAGSLLVAPAAFRPGAESRANAIAANMGKGELVGKVVNTSSRTLKRRVQVRAGGREWTLHVPNGAPVVSGKREVSVHNLDVGTYVRAIGTRIGNTRLKADHVYVIGDRLALRRSGYARRTGESGYFASYAGYRSRYRR
jgi:hypothetical protein